MQSAFTVLSENWTIDPRQRRQLDALIDPATRTYSCLVKEYLAACKSTRTPERKGARTLRKTIARKLRQVFCETHDVQADILELLASFENQPSVIEPVFLTLPYASIRASARIAREFGFAHVAANIAALRDIDQAILAGEELLRESDNREEHNLVSITDLKEILQCDSEPEDPTRRVTYTRQPIPASELPLLDERRPETIRFMMSDDVFREQFSASFPEFHGLDWSNTLAVGHQVLLTFLDEQNTSDFSELDPSAALMELRLFALSPAAATAKVRDIYRTWCSYLPNGDTPCMTKSPSCIQFTSDRLRKRLVIPLRVWQTATDALLDVALDPCAIGFNGDRILMLPRCARAIETGYSIITTRLIFDRTFSEPSTTTAINQVLNYRNRGFGIRTIRAYSQFIGRSELEPTYFNKTTTANEWASKAPLQCPADQFRSLTAYRRSGMQSESGIKSLRRIAYLGQDRFYHVAFGQSPLTTQFDPAVLSPSDAIANRPDYIEAKKTHFQQIKSTRQDLDPSYMEQHCDQRNASSVTQSFADPPSSRGLLLDMMPFEAFVRYSEEWAYLDRVWQAGSYDEESYVEKAHSCLPQFSWTWCIDDFGLSHRFAQTQNDKAFSQFIRAVIRDRVMGDYAFGYKGYLTSRVRLLVANADADVVLAQKLSVPMLITQVAEDELRSMLHPATIAPICRMEAHLPGSDYVGGIPPVPEDQGERGNMRYISIEPNMMWRGFDHERDQAMEVTYILAFLTAAENLDTHTTHTSCSDPALIEDLQRTLCHRQAGMLPQHSKNDSVQGTLISVREAMLYRAWVMAIPPQSVRASPTKLSTGGVGDEAGDIDLNYLYPFPEELFWGPEFEDDADNERATKRVRKSTLLGDSEWRPWWFREEAYADIADGL